MTTLDQILRTRAIAVAALLLVFGQVAASPGQDGSLMARALQDPEARNDIEPRQTSTAGTGSLFHVQAPEPRSFRAHDLVQILVRETSTAKSSQELNTEKDYNVTGDIGDWPSFSLRDLLNLQLKAGQTTGPSLDVQLTKDFDGEGEYARKDDLVARLTAEVLEVLPNGTLILEARTEIRTDEESSILKLTGICRPIDVTAANTILSSQVHELKIVKEHTGELKKASTKGLIPRVLDFFFAW